MQFQNRPRSANDVVEKLKELGKTAVQKALDELVAKGKVFEKVYGKQKVYCVVQDDVDPEKLRGEMEEIERSIAELSGTLQSGEKKLKNCEIELKNLASSLSTEQAGTEKGKLEMEVERLRCKLDVLQQNATPVSPGRKRSIEKDHERFMKEYRKRKRICTDIIDSIMEGYPKKKKDLIEELGIETDEDVGCNIGK